MKAILNWSRAILALLIVGVGVIVVLAGCDKKADPVPQPAVVVTQAQVAPVAPTVSFPVSVGEKNADAPVKVGVGLAKLVVNLTEDTGANEKWVVHSKVPGLYLADESKKGLTGTLEARVFRFDVKPAGTYQITFDLSGNGGYGDVLRSVTFTVVAE
jgi:hypothetical protein